MDARLVSRMARARVFAPFAGLFRAVRHCAMPLCALLFCAGCAVGMLPMLETASTALTLGSLGQTLVEATYLGKDDNKVAVAWMPKNYENAFDKMIRESWEQNYQYIKGVQWEDENIPWKDLTRVALRKAGDDRPILVLIQKKLARQVTVREERTFYTTVSGRLVRNPAEAAGESYFPHTRVQQQVVSLYTYTAYFFTRSRQPSGLLVTDAPKSGVCGSGALIRAVGKKTPGDKAALRGGDIITHVNGRRASQQTAFSFLVPGANTLRVCRQGTVTEHALELPTAMRKNEANR
ncbi:MAG: hypothetical protein DELT_02871 [Desulfovibrio sp.]